MADSRNKSSTKLVFEGVAACLSRHVRAGQSVVVGYSGGLDSTVLLHATSGMAREAKIKLSALHVHHGLSSHADDWARTCADICQGLEIPLTLRRVTVPTDTGEGIESAARSVRHQALADWSADWIFLGHHADDQAETVLHNLLRGAGVRGAAGIPEMRGGILRPLLGVPREILLAYAQEHQLTWVEDESNSDIHYTRNYLRREILPLITSRFPGARDRLAAAAARFSEAESLLDDLAIVDLDGGSRKFPVSMTLLRNLSDARARNLLRAMLAWHRIQPPDERRLKEFVRQLRKVGNDRNPRIDLASYSLWCEAGLLHFKLTA